MRFGWTEILTIFLLQVFNLPFGMIFFSIAKRKGIKKYPAFFIGLIPMVNCVYGFWLASLTDKEVKDFIEKKRDAL